ncbi:MAG TPA: alpha/beta fold hydrolase [Gaiellaceae bacterium]|nr:alpha/beta fold hydrolase [Gaiellaceae bacterium]
MHVEVENARLWVEDEGGGPPVLFVHGGLGDSRLWEPVTALLRDSFRCVRYDLRFWGRSTGPAEPFSFVRDAVGVLDALEIERAALVGLSMGGGTALDVALAHPERVTALVHVAAGMSGRPVDVYSAEQQAYENELDADLEVWAPLGADDRIRELWQATPEAQGYPEEAEPERPPAADPSRLQLPVLVLVAKHDPVPQQEVGRTLAREAPNAELIEIDSDHYLTLREPEKVADHIRRFLSAS